MAKYSDFRVNVDIHPLKGDLVPLEDADAVKRSIRNLLTTRPGERFYDNIALGSGLDDVLFENVTREFEEVVSDQIKRTLANYEPRAIVKQVAVKAQEDQNRYAVDLMFSVKNLPSVFSLSLLLYRVR